MILLTNSKTRALYECMHGPAGRPADNLLNSDSWEVYRQTVPELMVRVYWQPCGAILQQFCFDLHWEQK
jgi:hypothetical protein